MVPITTADVLPNDGASPPRTTPQPAVPIRVSALIYFLTYQAERTPQYPTTTTKFVRTPGHVNPKIINNKTKSGKAIYNQATRLLFSNSEGKFALTNEGILKFIESITSHAKSCG